MAATKSIIISVMKMHNEPSNAMFTFVEYKFKILKHWQLNQAVAEKYFRLPSIMEPRKLALLCTILRKVLNNEYLINYFLFITIYNRAK